MAAVYEATPGQAVEHAAWLVAAAVEGASRGGKRHEVAAAASAAIRTAWHLLGHGTTHDPVEEEVQVRVSRILPVLTAKVRAGAAGVPAGISGSSRAARNLAEHALLGEGAGAIVQALRTPQRSQRGGRRARARAGRAAGSCGTGGSGASEPEQDEEAPAEEFSAPAEEAALNGEAAAPAEDEEATTSAGEAVLSEEAPAEEGAAPAAEVSPEDEKWAALRAANAGLLRFSAKPRLRESLDFKPEAPSKEAVGDYGFGFLAGGFDDGGSKRGSERLMAGQGTLHGTSLGVFGQIGHFPIWGRHKAGQATTMNCQGTVFVAEGHFEHEAKRDDIDGIGNDPRESSSRPSKV